MHDLFVNYLHIFIGVIAVLELGFIVLFARLFAKTKSKMVLAELLITCGLFIDSFFIFLGVFVPAGLPLGLSLIRFIAHGALIPLLFVICGYGLELNPKVLKIVWIVTLCISALGIAHAFALDYDLVTIGKITRHATAKATSAFWALKVSNLLSYGTVIPLMICGIIVWIRKKNPFLFLSGFAMFAFSALGPATGNFDLIFAISMLGELGMITFFLLDAKKRLK